MKSSHLTPATLTFLLLACPGIASASWLCDEAASIKKGNFITACGISEDPDEDAARKSALTNAMNELDAICSRSLDCRDFELVIEPLRTECSKTDDKFTCRRAIKAEITSQKKEVTPPRQANAPDLKQDPGKCAHDTKKALSLFADLSSEEKISDAVRSAIQIPFRTPCADFHRQVMSLLQEEKVTHGKYEDFLLKTLTDNEDPSEIPNGILIVEYLSLLRLMDERTWSASRDFFTRTPKTLLYQLSPFLFQPREKSEKAVETQTERLDELVKLAREKKIGRPTPLDFDSVFNIILRGLLESPNNEQPWLAYRFVEKHLNKLAFTQPDELNFHLNRLYENLTDDSNQREVVKWISANINKSPLKEISYKSAMEFVTKAEKSRGKNPEQKKSHQSLYFELSEKRIDEIFAGLNKPHEIDAAARFCLANNLACTSVLPDQQKLIAILEDSDPKARRFAVDVLVARPEMARKLDEHLFRALNTEINTKRDHYVVSGAIGALLNAGVSDSGKARKILELSFERLFNYDDAIKKLGPAAVAPLIEIANDNSHSSQMTAIRSLGGLASNDERALDALQKLSRKNSSRAARDAAKEELTKLRR